MYFRINIIKSKLVSSIFIGAMMFFHPLCAQSTENGIDKFKNKNLDISNLSKYPNLSFVPDKWSRNQISFEEFILSKNLMGIEYGTTSIDTMMVATVNFRVNKALLEADYQSNPQILKEVDRLLSNKDILDKLDYILIIAGSSPEGGIAVNKKLATERAQAMRSYLMWKYPYLNRDMIFSFSIGEDWVGLRNMIEKDSNTPNGAEIISIIDSTEDKVTRLSKIKSLGNGSSYKYIAQHMLPKLRGATTIALHFKRETGSLNEKEDNGLETNGKSTNEPIIIIGEKEQYIESVEQIKSVDNNENNQTAEPVISLPETTLGNKNTLNQSFPESICYTKKTFMALKTNLLSDLISGINIELEIPIGNRWSVLGEYVFPWWLYESKQIALQTLNGTLETRYWFRNRTENNKLTGFFLGAYGGTGYYDIEWLKKGYQGEFFHTGLSGGFAHSISKYGDLRMEYSLGLGYMGTKFREYKAVYGLDDEWHLIRKRNGVTSYFGPTRAKVSIVWMLNRFVPNK